MTLYICSDCGARFRSDYGFLSHCRETRHSWDGCPDCDGEGDYLAADPDNPGKWIVKTCQTCHGTGAVA